MSRVEDYIRLFKQDVGYWDEDEREKLDREYCSRLLSLGQEMSTEEQEQAEAVLFPALSCPFCDAPGVVTTYEVDRINYGAGVESRIIRAVVPVRSCTKCGERYFDHEGELARELAVQQAIGNVFLVIGDGELSAHGTELLARNRVVEIIREKKGDSTIEWDKGLLESFRQDTCSELDIVKLKINRGL